jgi:hypothetical protein
LFKTEQPSNIIETEEKDGEQTTPTIKPIPTDLLQYLFDTFFAFDLDCKGCLNSDELILFLEVICLDISSAEFISEVSDFNYIMLKLIILSGSSSIQIYCKRSR